MAERCARTKSTLTSSVAALPMSPASNPCACNSSVTAFVSSSAGVAEDEAI